MVAEQRAKYEAEREAERRKRKEMEERQKAEEYKRLDARADIVENQQNLFQTSCKGGLFSNDILRYTLFCAKLNL